jgi:hypothetical protein
MKRVRQLQLILLQRWSMSSLKLSLIYKLPQADSKVRNPHQAKMAPCIRSIKRACSYSLHVYMLFSVAYLPSVPRHQPPLNRVHASLRVCSGLQSSISCILVLRVLFAPFVMENPKCNSGQTSWQAISFTTLWLELMGSK